MVRTMNRPIVQRWSLRAGATRVLLTLAALFCLPVSHAALLVYDGFNYSVGEELGESSSRTHWANDKNQFTIARGSLDYAGLKASTGNRLNVAAAAPSLDSVRTLDGSWPKQSRGTLYVSFLLRLGSVVEVGDSGEGTSLVTLGDTFNDTQLLGINLRVGGGARLGVLKYPSSSASVSSSAFFTSGPGANLSAEGATTYLIVAKYEWREGADNDAVTLWVNPARLGATEDPANQVATHAGEDGAGGAGRLTLSRGPNVSIDELRIGQTWADVTPPSRPPQHLLVVVGVLVGGLVAAGLWITKLRRRVEERSIALGAQIRERQKAEHQRLMEQERARIARDLHDELGADITEISMLATRAGGDAGGEEGRRCLTQLADKTRTMVAKLEEIVWAMNPQHDSLGAVVSYFTFLADRLLGLANIRLTVDASEDAAKVAVEARVRYQLFLVFKESLANVIRHSGASEVRLAVRVENRILRVEVADNGCGLREPANPAGGHAGIANMRKRMEKLGGQFEIAAEPGRGTTVKFSVPLEA
jgi:signal transduction histidine kinase